MKRCIICNKGVVTSFRVTYSHKRTKRKVYPNLQKVRAIINNRKQKVWVCTKCIKAGKITKV
jgi:large subunit ribosomal protein L28